jgi:hypothetical protein
MICSPPGLAGPSLVDVRPSRTVTVVAVAEGWTGSPAWNCPRPSTSWKKAP